MAGQSLLWFMLESYYLNVDVEVFGQALRVVTTQGNTVLNWNSLLKYVPRNLGFSTCRN